MKFNEIGLRPSIPVAHFYPLLNSVTTRSEES
jgi:hypothetical protein